YADSMAARPLLTKMGTSAAIFGASDASAQALERAPALDRTRLAVTTAIGGFYFAPAAHVWYGAITKAIPANDLRAILTKALLGQLIFGPLVTCVFFASARVPGRETKIALPGKIRSDLLGVQAAGLGFWPFVDLVSYACLPVDYIPVFVNGASFVWTIFLSFKSRAA
ncbi:hypothetical protein AURANDRAFT_5477, partial [Aureococcus anophagefferens]